VQILDADSDREKRLSRDRDFSIVRSNSVETVNTNLLAIFDLKAQNAIHDQLSIKGLQCSTRAISRRTHRRLTPEGHDKLMFLLSEDNRISIEPAIVQQTSRSVQFTRRSNFHSQLNGQIGGRGILSTAAALNTNLPPVELYVRQLAKEPECVVRIVNREAGAYS